MTTPEHLHPTALVDPKASLGAGVRVGAFSIIGAEVTLGDGAEIGHHCVLEGLVEIGARAKIGHGSILGGRPQDLKYRDETRSGVRIGADTAIREYVTIHRASLAEGWTETPVEDATQVFLDKCRGWEDARSPEEIIAEIYAARTVSHRGAALFPEETA